MRISDWSSDVCSSDVCSSDLGTDVALMNGLLAHCRDQGLIDEAFLGQSVNVPDGFWDGLADCDLWSAAGTCDVAPADLRRFFDLFAANPRTITLFSQGINQSIRGTDQVNAIVNEIERASCRERVCKYV